MADGSQRVAPENLPPNELFKKRIFHKAPIILTSCHGMYELHDAETTEELAFIVPPHTLIFETSTIGDYTMTTIDELLWILCQGKYRRHFLAYLTGKFGGMKLEDISPEFAAVIRAIRLYVPGQKIYSRTLSIGGGRASPSSGARRVFANMGFYKFEVDSPALAKFPDDINFQILKDFRRRLIENEDLHTDYREVISKTRSEEGGLDEDAPAIFVFSCCAEARKQYSDTKEEGYRAALRAIETRQANQDRWFLTKSPMGLGGPGDKYLNIRERQAREAANVAAGALPVANRKASLRLPELFAESVTSEDDRELAQPADPKILERIDLPPPAAPMEQPPGTKVIFFKPATGAAGGAGAAREPPKIQIYSMDGDPFLTSRELRRVKREFPPGKFYELREGDLTEIDPMAAFGGGRRQRQRRTRHRARRHRATRRNLKRHK
jgi:hypothetical protein